MLSARPFTSGALAQRSGQLTRKAVVVKCVAQPSHRASPVTAKQQAQGATCPAGLLAAGALLAPLVLDVQASLAAGGEYGLLEGRSAALLHPLIMGILFGATGWAGWLGWQWRRTRTIGDDIKALKAQMPKPAAGEAEAPAAPAALTQQLSALEKERKDLVAGGYRDKHFWWGSVLLGGGVFFAIEGAFNTWFRTGKLFPGPHLFAGAGIVALWALAAALVPQMQKGNEGARNAHIALNALNLALFAWQVPTGLEIVGKVFEFTKWP